MPAKIPPLQLPEAADTATALAGVRKALIGWAILVANLLNRPVLDGLSMFTVAALPATAGTGAAAYASNGRKVGEGVGAGTGVLVYKSANGSWYRASDDTVVAA